MVKRLLAEYPNQFALSVSHTTRSPRDGEEDGTHYNFTTKEHFKDLISQNAFIEHAQFGSNLYGTSFAAVEAIEREGKICVLDIEMEGVKQMHKSHLRARYLFMKPPSEEILAERLRGRGDTKEEDVKMRLEQAKVEMKYAETEGVHDDIIVNDDLEKAWMEFLMFCLSEA